MIFNSYLNVGTPLSALIPAPDRTTMFLALENSSLKAFMSLEGPEIAISAYRSGSTPPPAIRNHVSVARDAISYVMCYVMGQQKHSTVESLPNDDNPRS